MKIVSICRLPVVCVIAFIVLLTGLLPVQADEVTAVYPLAVFPFQERGRDVSELGGTVTDLLFANLVINPEMYLVDREDLKKILDEQELNLSGLVNPDMATKVGHLTGAKILITGSVLQVDTTLYVIAKIIGTETSRVLGASVKGGVRDELDGLIEDLAEKVGETVSKRAGDLVAKPVTREDRLAALKKKIGNGKRPTVFIDVTERHVGQTAIDPAAETELTLFCTSLGFEVIDREEGNRNEADVLIVGEGFSEFAARHGNLISVKARLEVKAVDRDTGRILAIDRHVAVAVDLTEQIAGKTALRDAAANIAGRLLPPLVGPDKEKAKKEKGGKAEKNRKSAVDK
jgi:TolB-like protein